MKKFFEKRIAAEAFREELLGACKGLLFSSETDAAVEPFFSEAGGDDLVAVVNEALGRKRDEPLEDVDFEEFLGKLERIRDWYGPEEKKIARGFAGLRKILAKNLKGLRVFRAGRVRIDIFIIGKDSEGKIAGVRTYSVES